MSKPKRGGKRPGAGRPPMDGEHKRYTLWLKVQHMDTAKRCAKENNVTLSEWVRDAIAEKLERELGPVAF